MDFALGLPVPFEESLTCEFKEVRGRDPVREIAQDADEYAVAFLNEKGGSIYWGVRDTDRVVTGVALDAGGRDRLRQVVGQKLAAIAPPIPPGSYDMPLHPVGGSAYAPPPDLYVVELKIQEPHPPALFLTSGGQAFRKLLGGKKKLSGTELLAALFGQLEAKEKSQPSPPDNPMLLSLLPTVAPRAKRLAPNLEGASLLWVDDNPSSTFYERATLAALGMHVHVATSTSEGTYMAIQRPFDAVISDMKRAGDPEAGLRLLEELALLEIRAPVIFYIGQVNPSRPNPVGSFALTNRTADLFHFIFDALERRAPPSA